MSNALIQRAGFIVEALATDTVRVPGPFINGGTEASVSKAVTATTLLTAVNVSLRYNYFTGAAGASLALTFPSAALALDGQLITVMSVGARVLTTYVSAGATFVGGAATLLALTPYTFQFDLATLAWYRCG